MFVKCMCNDYSFCLQFGVNARFEADEVAVKDVNYSTLLGDIFNSPPNSSDPTVGAT